MNRKTRPTSLQHLAVAVAAATALAGALSTLAIAPAQAQTHATSGAHAHDAATPDKLALDHGRKWATDDPLRGGMARIRALVAPQLGAAHAGKLSAAQYAALAGQVETEVAGIVANCKLPPEADAMLHLVIAEIGAGTDALAGKAAGHSPQQGLVQIASAVNDYGRHFDHPGLKPISLAH